MLLGRSPPRVLLWRRAGLWWFEASRKYARPNNRNDESAEAEAAVASPFFFNSSWTGSSRKTGRSRNEGNYQATSVDVLRTLRGGKAGGEHGHNQSMHPSVGSPIATAGRLQVSGASQEEKRLQDAGWFAKLTPGAPISVQRRGDGTERL